MAAIVRYLKPDSWEAHLAGIGDEMRQEGVVAVTLIIHKSDHYALRHIERDESPVTVEQTIGRWRVFETDLLRECLGW